jgi:hypothetical protein
MGQAQQRARALQIHARPLHQFLLHILAMKAPEVSIRALFRGNAFPPVEVSMKAYGSFVAGLVAYGAISIAPAAYAAQSTSAISSEANAAVERIGKTLAQEDVSFTAKTMRVYQDSDGDYLHIVHNINVLAARPDKMAVTATGDDGATKLLYDGQQVSVFDAVDNKYAQVPMTGNLQHMLDEVSARLGVEFPLADLFGERPGAVIFDGRDQR